MTKRLLITAILFILFSIGLTLFTNNLGLNLVIAGTCTCCSDPIPGNDCPNKNTKNGDTCSSDSDMCGDKARCNPGTSVRYCDGGGGGCDNNKWGSWSACSASCPVGYGGLRYGTQKRKNDCNKEETRSCGICCAQPPTAPPLVSPANGSEVDSITPTLVWSPPSSWGFRCPNVQIRDFLLQVAPAQLNGSCSNISKWLYQITVDEVVTSASIPKSANLIWGTKYCWRVVAVNHTSVSSPLWSFTPNIDDFFMTYGGDVYMGGGVPEAIRSAPDLSTILLGRDTRPTTARIENIKSLLNGQSPFVSSNYFVSPSIINSTRASAVNKVVEINDSSTADEYSKSYTSNDNAAQRSYTSSYYSYYLEKFRNEAAKNSNIVSQRAGNTIWASTTQNKIRDLIGVNGDITEKRIVLLENSGPSSNFVLKTNPTVNAQRGFRYDHDDVFVLDNLNDWAGVTTAPNNELICEGQTVFLIPGNLTISADIINANRDSSCVFIVEGHLTINPVDTYGYTRPANFQCRIAYLDLNNATPVFPDTVLQNSLGVKIDYRRINLYSNTLNDFNLRDVDAVFIPGVVFTTGQARTLTEAELDIIKNNFNDGMNVHIGTDDVRYNNGLNSLFASIAPTGVTINNPNVNFASTRYTITTAAWGNTISFLKLIVDTQSGRINPGYVTGADATNSSCMSRVSNKCILAYFPPKDESGFLVFDGNNAVPTNQILANPTLLNNYCTRTGEGTVSKYRIIEGLFMANSVSISGKDDQGPVIVNGSILTNNTATTNLNPTHYDPFRSNKFDVKTFELQRPQILMTYDPRHLAIWMNEFRGDSYVSSIRESRFLKLIEVEDIVQQR